METFENKLNMIVSMEAPHARRDHERMGNMIGALMDVLALSVAIAAEGRPERISELLDGVSVNLYEAAAAKAPLARMIAGGTR